MADTSHQSYGSTKATGTFEGCGTTETETQHKTSRPLPLLVLNANFFYFFALFTIICVLVQIAIGAYASDHGQAGDEAAYFVSSLMIKSYVWHLFAGSLKSGLNPLRFALLYYSHFPRVGLGHYPPMFSAIQSALFIIFGGTGLVSGGFQATLGGLCATLPALLIKRQMGVIAGLCAGIAVLCSPVLLFLIGTDMADILLAVLVTLSAICWSWFYHERTWFSGIAFSIFSAASILTKGTAIGLAIFPVIYLVYKRDMWFIMSRKTIICGALVGACTAPWYILTYKMAAAGFNYSWGLAYTKVAVPIFLYDLVRSVGVPIAGLYVISVIMAAFKRRHLRGIDVHAFLAASISMILSPCVMPAALSARYLVPAIPSLVVAAFWCFSEILAIKAFAKFKMRSVALPAILLAVSTGSVFQSPHVEPFYSNRLASLVLKSGKKNPLVLVCGSTYLEGAVISSFAEQDTDMTHFVVRGTEVLARGNFMDTVYAARFANPARMAKWIKENQIGWIIEEDAPPAEEFPHCHMLRRLLRSGSLGDSPVASVRSLRNGGEKIALYQLPAVNKLPNSSDQIFSELKPSVRF